MFSAPSVERSDWMISNSVVYLTPACQTRQDVTKLRTKLSSKGNIVQYRMFTHSGSTHHWPFPLIIVCFSSQGVNPELYSSTSTVLDTNCMRIMISRKTLLALIV
jgi:hypothetical protein